MQKLYYSISEVSNIVNEEQYILRYWEKEFENLNPRKNRAGNRIYSEKDLFIIKTIKRLLRDEKLSLKGAKENLLKIVDIQFKQKNIKLDNSIEKDSSKLPEILDEEVMIKLKKRDAVELYNLLNEIVNIID